MTRRMRQTIGRTIRWPRIAAAVPIACGAAALLTGGEIRSYVDDTHAALRGSAVTLTGEQGFAPVRLSPTRGRQAVIDARRATMVVANSRNDRPTGLLSCETGDLATNPYPLTIERHSGAALVGGLFAGRVPQAADWRATYCNSAAVLFQDAPAGVVDGVRIARAWDGIRVGRGSAGLVVANSWLSEIRDDSLEDDYLLQLTVRDTLIDGAFQGVSVKPSKGKGVSDSGPARVTLSGVVLRLAAYQYQGAPHLGALAKSEERSPRLEVINSVIALDGGTIETFPRQWHWTWAKLARSSNNLFLWLGDGPVPATVLPRVGGFRVVQGPAAHEAWARARTNWINCHPRLARLASDPPSNPAACTAETWGGYTN